MRKLFEAMLVVFVAFALAGIPTALGANPNPQVIVMKNCPAASAQKTYKGNVIVIVSGNGCVTVDDGVVVKASGNATVAAHGNATVVASGTVTLVVYNEDVSCQIKGRQVTVVSAIRDSWGRVRARCLAARGR